MHRHFPFAIATLPLFNHPENVKITISPSTLSRQKCYIFSFCFRNSNVTTFPTSRKCKSFNFSFRLSQQKCWIFKSISRTFKNVLFPETWGRWLLWLKISSVQTFYFFSSNVIAFPTSRKCKDVNFSLHTVPAEMLYLQKYLKNFQKQSFAWKMMKSIVVEKFKSTDILLLQ